MRKSRKPRSDAKMYQLPKAVLDGVNERLVNYNMSYADIIAWLAEQGYKVSQSSLSRYAFKVFESAQRIADDLEKTKYIIDVIGRNPDLDTTEAPAPFSKVVCFKRYPPLKKNSTICLSKRQGGYSSNWPRRRPIAKGRTTPPGGKRSLPLTRWRRTCLPRFDSTRIWLRS